MLEGLDSECSVQETDAIDNSMTFRTELADYTLRSFPKMSVRREKDLNEAELSALIQEANEATRSECNFAILNDQLIRHPFFICNVKRYRKKELPF